MADRGAYLPSDYARNPTGITTVMGEDLVPTLHYDEDKGVAMFYQIDDQLVKVTHSDDGRVIITTSPPRDYTLEELFRMIHEKLGEREPDEE